MYSMTPVATHKDYWQLKDAEKIDCIGNINKYIFWVRSLELIKYIQSYTWRTVRANVTINFKTGKIN